MRSFHLAVLFATLVASPAAHAQTDAAAQLAFNQGRIALKETDYPAAIKHFEHAIQLENDNADNHYWLGRALYESAPRASRIKMPGIARHVRKEWERAVELNPNHVEARAGLAEYYAMAPGFMGGSKEKARAQAAQLLKHNAMRGAMAEASIAQHEKNLPAEEAAYERAIAAAPDSSAPYVALADASVRLHKWDVAFATIRRYANRRADDPWALYYTGRLAGSTGRQLDEGEKAMQEFLAAPPKDLTAPERARAFYWLGKIAERRGNKSTARERYQAALQANPKYELARNALEALK